MDSSPAVGKPKGLVQMLREREEAAAKARAEAAAKDTLPTGAAERLSGLRTWEQLHADATQLTSPPATLPAPHGRALHGDHPVGDLPTPSAPPRKWAPKLITDLQLAQNDYPPLKWAVPHILPEGATILAGKPKIGKSWLALGLARAVAGGGMALGLVPVECGPGLYLAMEDGERRLQARLKVMQGAKQAVSRGLLQFATEWQRCGEGGLDALEDWLKANPGARLIVVDVLECFRDHRRSQASFYEMDYAAIKALQQLALRYGVAILILHHTRKADASDAFDTVSGTTGLTGAADAALVLRRDRGSVEAKLHITGRDIEDEGELVLSWHKEAASWELLRLADGHPPAKSGSSEQAVVLALLRKAGRPLKPKEVAEALGKSPDAAKMMLSRMAKMGLLSADQGAYSLTGGG